MTESEDSRHLWCIQLTAGQSVPGAFLAHIPHRPDQQRRWRSPFSWARAV